MTSHVCLHQFRFRAQNILSAWYLSHEDTTFNRVLVPSKIHTVTLRNCGFESRKSNGFCLVQVCSCVTLAYLAAHGALLLLMESMSVLLHKCALLKVPSEEGHSLRSSRTLRSVSWQLPKRRKIPTNAVKHPKKKRAKTSTTPRMKPVIPQIKP